MKTLFLGLAVTLVLASFMLVLVSGAAVVEIAVWVGGRRGRRRN
ncbi:MAG: hypothetical protein Q8L69_08455 [Gallionellaceae bacterium]|nr:hypothetical protein [Gallionellaceae bacterium]